MSEVTKQQGQDLGDTPGDHLTVAILSDMHAYAKGRDGRTDAPSHLECGMREDDPNSHPVIGLGAVIDKHSLEAPTCWLCGRRPGR